MTVLHDSLSNNVYLNDLHSQLQSIEFLESVLQSYHTNSHEKSIPILLLEFLISKSLMDCSIFIQLSKNPLSEKEEEEEEKTFYYNGIYYSFKIIDVEPKSIHKIPTYLDKERQAKCIQNHSIKSFCFTDKEDK